MINEIFKSLLVMSLVGGLLTAVLLVLKPITVKAFGHKWQYYIWHSVLWVLVLPVKVSTSWSLPTQVSSKIEAITAQPIYERMVLEDINGIYHAQNISQTAENIGVTIFSALAFCWIAVAVILVIKTVFNYVRFKGLLKMNSVPLTNLDGVSVRVCGLISTPLLLGAKTPALYVPNGMDENLDRILAHEKVHIKRNDLVYKWFVALVKCIHWFNPLVYVMAKQFEEACEISCDVQATAIMSRDEKREYMHTLIDVSQKSLEDKTALALGLSSGGRTLIKRLHSISGSNKRPRILTFVGVMIAMLITFVSVYAGGVLQNSVSFPQNIAEYILVSPKVEKVENEPEIQEKVPEVNIETSIETEAEEPVESAESVKNIIRGDFSTAGGNTRSIYGVKANSEGCINVEIHSSAQEIVDVYVQNAETGKDVFSFSIPVPYSAAYSVEGLEPGKSYNIVLKGEMRDNWNIDGEYIIQY